MNTGFNSFVNEGRGQVNQETNHFVRPEFSIREPVLASLALQPEVYRNYPAYQRHYTWSPRYRQDLIDTILRGQPIPALMAFKHVDTGGERLFIIDGKQRQETIYTFMEDGFPTPRTVEKPYAPLYPGLYYSQLPEKVKRFFDAYTLRYQVLLNVHQYTEQELSLMFRRLQNSQKLTSAELIYGFDGMAPDLARRLSDLAWWNRLPPSARTRRGGYYFSLVALLLEENGGFAGTDTESIKRFIQRPSATLSEQTYRSVLARLNRLDGPTKSLRITSIPDMVIIYQAECILSGMDVVWSSVPDDALTYWLYQIRETFNQENTTTSKKMRPWNELSHRNRQHGFWSRYGDTLKTAVSAQFKDPQRVYRIGQKVQLWMNQQGLCAECKQPVNIDDVGHHRVLHSRGGPTTIENGALIHVGCHRELHSAGK